MIGKTNGAKNSDHFLRPPDQVMRLSRMGCYHPMRLSFSRQLIRHMHQQNWQVDVPICALDQEGYGHVVIRASSPSETYSLVAFSNQLEENERSDRVIADAWDTTFTLYDGMPDQDAINRMAKSVPYQEAGRQSGRQLTLSRANKSVRIFNHVVDCLAKGVQPDPKMIISVGYLMRTTAVYGNGKFGICDRENIDSQNGMGQCFQAEMLTVYLIRHFSHLLIAHLAKVKGGDKAVPLEPKLARHLGIGNATGLGMAPFLVNHQQLLHQWIQTREEAIALVIHQRTINQTEIDYMRALISRAQAYTAEWRVDDKIQMARIDRLEDNLADLSDWFNEDSVWHKPKPLLKLLERAEQHLSLEAVEMLVSIMIEPFGALIDHLSPQFSIEEESVFSRGMKVAKILSMIERFYDWALEYDMSDPDQSALFWYTSEAKLEPRLGRRYEEDGADQEMPFDIPKQIQAAHADLKQAESHMLVAEFLMQHPDHRFILRRVMTTALYPYAEIRDNLVATTTRPIDMLRCKLSFLGAAKFDPKSDLWTRISLFQGAPLADELTQASSDDWLFPALF